MAPNALFVNIARGKMVDEKAMAEVAAEKEIFLALYLGVEYRAELLLLVAVVI